MNEKMRALRDEMAGKGARIQNQNPIKDNYASYCYGFENGFDAAAEIYEARITKLREALKIISSMKKEIEQPGLTWEQIEYLFTELGNKPPLIVTQDEIF